MSNTTSPSSESAAEILEKLAADSAASDTADDVQETSSEEAVVAEEEEVSEEPKKGRKGKYVPYDRFKEVVEDKNQYKKQLEILAQREQELQANLQNVEQELSVLERIRQAAFDDKVGKHVIALDKWLKGEPIDDAVEAAEREIEENEEGLSKKEIDALKNQVGKKVEDLENQLLEQRAEVILQKANSIGTKMLESLDDSYTEEDVKTISELWTPRIDWDAIEENPEILEKELNKSFREVLELYGTPRGALIKNVASNIKETMPQSSESEDPEQFLEKVSNVDWGKLKDGKPVVSDSEFSKVMAEVLRKSRGL